MKKKQVANDLGMMYNLNGFLACLLYLLDHYTISSKETTLRRVHIMMGRIKLTEKYS